LHAAVSSDDEEFTFAFLAEWQLDEANSLDVGQKLVFVGGRRGAPTRVERVFLQQAWIDFFEFHSSNPFVGLGKMLTTTATVAGLCRNTIAGERSLPGT
jgi:hypothetical protein